MKFTSVMCSLHWGIFPNISVCTDYHFPSLIFVSLKYASQILYTFKKINTNFGDPPLNTPFIWNCPTTDIFGRLWPSSVYAIQRFINIFCCCHILMLNRCFTRSSSCSFSVTSLHLAYQVWSDLTVQLWFVIVCYHNKEFSFCHSP